MNLTQGYHQAALTCATSTFTAFITFCGLYSLTIWVEASTIIFLRNDGGYCVNWINIPYMWDVYWWLNCVWKSDFVSRLCSIFERFRLRNLLSKASKCKSGYAELDFVGKVISEEGPQMSSTRIQSVLDFPVPVYAKHLKRSLGTVNYFRDFIRNQSFLVTCINSWLW